MTCLECFRPRSTSRRVGDREGAPRLATPGGQIIKKDPSDLIGNQLALLNRIRRKNKQAWNLLCRSDAHLQPVELGQGATYALATLSV